jgi:hypothetical protein
MTTARVAGVDVGTDPVCGPGGWSRSCPSATPRPVAVHRPEPGAPATAPAAPAGAGGPPAAGRPDGGERRDARARLYVAGDAPLMVAPVAALVAELKGELTEAGISTPSLEDVFI